MYPNYFKKYCQRVGIIGLLAAAPCWALESGASLELPIAPSERKEGLRLPDFLKGLSRLRLTGSFSLNWRNVGPRKPGFETQIQDEVYLADMFFGVTGPVVDGVPFQVEWALPTGGQGALRLNQLYFEYDRISNWKFQFGKFLVPFGRYNELYKPDEFLTVTRPLLWAAPDSLDLVVRPNSPRPPLSYGYADIGARVSYYPPSLHPLMPSELTWFVINGLGESSNRQRTFPDPSNLGIPPPPTNGVFLDFGHENHNLADNNNPKSVGARAVFGLGDVRLPWPLPEDQADLKGMTVGLSAMGGNYELEGQLKYEMYGVDASFSYRGFNFSGEYVYSADHFLAPLMQSTALAVPLQHARGFEVNQGYFVQTSFPIMRKPPVGKRLTGVLVFNQMFRRAPILDFLLNVRDNNTFTVFPSVTAIQPGALLATTRMTKYTAALNYQVNDHFYVKADYSYWVMGKASIRTETSLGLVDIYQGAFSMVVTF
jgi:hypothetical protein